MDGAHHAAFRPNRRKHQGTPERSRQHRRRGAPGQSGRTPAAQGGLPFTATLPLRREASLLYHKRKTLLQAFRCTTIHPRMPEIPTRTEDKQRKVRP